MCLDIQACQKVPEIFHDQLRQVIQGPLYPFVGRLPGKTNSNGGGAFPGNCS